MQNWLGNPQLSLIKTTFRHSPKVLVCENAAKIQEQETQCEHVHGIKPQISIKLKASAIESAGLLHFFLPYRSLLANQKDGQSYKQNPSLINFSITIIDIRLSKSRKPSFVGCYGTKKQQDHEDEMQPSIISCAFSM